MIWLSDCFVRCGKGFRRKPQFKVSEEALRNLEIARGKIPKKIIVDSAKENNFSEQETNTALKLIKNC